ncbi:MAG: riboflavin synthase [Deltaproteobacteria bacterium]|nr:riboflavin synthase [Deltaproteobacteria bacterium]
MFTGLVEGLGEIAQINRLAEGIRLALTPPFPVAELTVGESVSVSGACLTVVSMDAQTFHAEVSPETLARTTLGLKKVKDTVNLERALKIGDRLGGHLVTGHVDAVGTVRERREGPDFFTLSIDFPAPLAPYIIEKGSIAVDGVSLTVNSVQGHRFSVYIIPHTAQKTTLAHLKAGEKVNLETDIIGKYVARLLGPYRGGASDLTKDFLAEHGFL